MTDNSMIVDVRLRQEECAESAPFTTWDLNHLDSLLELLRRWGGVYLAGEGTYQEFSGQFVIDGSEAFFEIIASGDPA